MVVVPQALFHGLLIGALVLDALLVQRLAAVVQAYMDHLGIRYEGLGAWLLKHLPSESGLEPDDCYILHDTQKPRPDIAIEVLP